MKILVTGGLGFIGSHIVNKYLELGHYVIVVDKKKFNLEKNTTKNSKLYQLDLRHTTQFVDIVKKEKPDIINHQAADPSLRKSFSEISESSTNNIGATLSIIEATQHYSPKKIIFASSGGAIYSEKNQAHKESEFCKPTSPYGIGKQTCEELLKFNYRYYNIPYIALRYGNVYGPKQDSTNGTGIISILIENLLLNQPTHIFGDGENIRDYIYIEDIVNANFLALYTKHLGPVNIGTGIGTSINNIAKTIVNYTKKECKLNFRPPYKYGEQKVNVLNIELAKKKMNWYPKTSINSGIAKTLDWYIKNKTKLV